MYSYKELEVWKQSIVLVELIYQLTKNFPEEEKSSLSSQLQRSAVSIPSNIAEGWGRLTTSDYIHFLVIARGSLLELETQIFIANKLNYINELQVNQLQNQLDAIGKMLNAMIKTLRAKKSAIP